MKPIIRSMAMIVASLCATVALAGDKAPMIMGHWKSVSPEAQGQTFATREFKFHGPLWRVKYRAFADAQAKQPLFTIEVSGFYVLGDKSAKVADAYEGVFPAKSKQITADSPAGVALFEQMGCKLAVGVPKSLLSQSCGFLASQMQAMGEYDLVSLKGKQLFMGDRSGDLTKARPERLSEFPLVRD